LETARGFPAEVATTNTNPSPFQPQEDDAMCRCKIAFGWILPTVIGFLCFGGLGSAVHAKPIEISVATNMGPQSPEYKAIERFAQLVAEKSQDQLKIVMFGSAVLGSEETAFKGVNLGAVDVVIGSMNIATKMYVPATDYFTPPFVYSDFEHFIRFCKSPYAKSKWEELSKKANVVMLNSDWTWRRGPFRVLCSKNPIKTIDDIKGLKLRFYPSNLEIDVWRSLGATPTVIAWGETYLALQQGIVEAVTSPVTLILDTKFVEVCPYVTREDEFPQTICFYMNHAKFKNLTDTQQKALLDACNQAGTEFTAGLDALAEKILGEAKAKYGITYSTIDMGPFITKARQFYEESRKKGSLPKEFWEVIDAIEATR
jgi:TRAP-type transport system periplasmic protein